MPVSSFIDPQSLGLNEEPFPTPPPYMPPPETPAPAETPAPTNVPVATQGVAANRPMLPAQPVSQQPSMLDRLRESVMREIMPEQTEDWQRRLRTFGAGVAGAGPTDFFTGLAAGSKAVEDQRKKDQEARANVLRSAEEADYRRAQQRLAEAKEQYDRDPTNPVNILRLAQARYYAGGGAGGGSTRGQLTPQAMLRAYSDARRLAQQAASRDPSIDVDQLTEQLFARAVTAGGGTVPGQQAPQQQVRRIESGIE